MALVAYDSLVYPTTSQISEWISKVEEVVGLCFFTSLFENYLYIFQRMRLAIKLLSAILPKKRYLSHKSMLFRADKTQNERILRGLQQKACLSDREIQKHLREKELEKVLRQQSEEKATDYEMKFNNERAQRSRELYGIFFKLIAEILAFT